MVIGGELRSMLLLVSRQTPDILLTQIRKPDGTHAGAHAVATLTDPLTDDGVGFGIDLGEGKSNSAAQR